MTIKQKINKAKIMLLKAEPWLGQLACFIDFIEDDKVETACIDIKGKLRYNVKFLEPLSAGKISFLIMHELFHLIYQHPVRIKDRDQLVFNMAADIKVNSDLDEIKHFEEIDGILKDDDRTWKVLGLEIQNIKGKTTEIIYDELMKGLPQKLDLDSKISKDLKEVLKSFIKDLKKSNAPIPESESQVWHSRFEEAVQSTKSQGNVPAGLLRELDKFFNPEVPWHRIIRQRFLKSLYVKNWKRVAKNWLPEYFPGRAKKGSLRAVCAIDTSGSISQKELTKFVSELWSLASSFKIFKITVMFNDAEVWEILEVNEKTRSKLLSLEPKGGGGTSFIPVFEKIKELFKDKIDCLIFFTDLYGEFPSYTPLYPTYWVSATDEIQIPFGKLVKLQKVN